MTVEIRLSFHTLVAHAGLTVEQWPKDSFADDLRAFVQTTEGRHELCDKLDLHPSMSAEDLVEFVLRCVERHELGVRERRFRRTNAGESWVGAHLRECEDEARVAHTVVIELVGEDEEPHPGVLCELVLPDGGVRQARIDHDGRAEFRDIADAGNCTLRFPELDAAAWEHLESSAL